MPSTETVNPETPRASLGCARCDNGFWVNPRNAMDRRPCFNCNPSAARSAYRPRYRVAPVAPAPVAATVDPNGTLLSSLPGGRRGMANWQAFAMANPAEAAWLAAGWANGNDFARSLIAGCARYGGLTPRQLAAVQRNLPAPAAVNPPDVTESLRSQVVETGTAAVVIAPPPVIIEAGPLRSALDAAAASGLRKVRLTLGDLEFRRGFNGRLRNTEGQILVYRRADGRWSYVGKIAADGRWLGQEPAGLVDQIRETCADPRAAASAHGHDTGYCACCRRLLTDPPSVMAGIGPVCIRRFNWGF